MVAPTRRLYQAMYTLDITERELNQPSPFNFLSALCLVALVVLARWWWGVGE